MKIIHLKCGHKIKVSSWPSRTGLAKVRHHYKVYHSARMKAITRKSLATKRKRGIINPFDPRLGIERLRSEYRKLSTFPLSHYNEFRKMFSEADDKTIRILANAKIKFVSVIARNEMIRRGLTNKPKRRKGLVNPKRKRIRYKMADYGYERPLMAAEKRKAKKSALIYDKLLTIEAHKSHGKFKGQNFYHDFKRDTDAVVMGNPDGSLTIRSKKGKRLWRRFKY